MILDLIVYAIVGLVALLHVAIVVVAFRDSPDVES